MNLGAPELLAAGPRSRRRKTASGPRALKSAARRRRPRRTERSDGVVVGVLTGWNDAGEPLVDYPDRPGPAPLAARSTTPLNQLAAGCELALMFVEGDWRRPLVIGVVQPPAKELAFRLPRPVAAEADSERLELTAAKEIVLRCGEASITLTKAGKIILRGAYLLSRSSGVNRIKGGSVQIN